MASRAAILIRGPITNMVLASRPRPNRNLYETKLVCPPYKRGQS
jgi:hypothetical protein